MRSRDELRRDQVARQLGYGMSVEAVARLHRLTPYGLHRLLDDPHMQRLREQYEEEFKVRQVARTVELEACWPKALEAIEAALGGEIGTIRDRLDSAWKLVDTLMPSKRQQVEVEAMVKVGPEAVEQLTEAVRGAATLLRSRDGTYRLEDDPHLEKRS